MSIILREGCFFMSDNLSNIWNSCLNLIKSNKEFDNLIYENFLADSTLYKIDNNIAYILVRDLISVHTLSSDNNLKIIETYLNEITQTNFKIKIISSLSEEDSVELFDSNSEVQESNLISNFTFDNFVVGNSNKESYQASLAVASDPGNLFNPLFIYGKSGLGKTHLAHAIGNTIKINKPNMRILYVTSETFLKDFLSVIDKSKNNEWFDKKYRDIDVLIIDDIQFLSRGNKKETNEMFFNVYNNLFNLNKQIVITSDVMPSQLNGLEERLVSRFSQGLSVNVNPPELETSILILKNKIANLMDSSLKISEEAIEYLAKNFSKDVRELDGALNRLIFYSINIDDASNITLENVKNAFQDYHIPKVKGDNTPEKILKAVCHYYNITKAQIVSNSRQKKIAVPRHVAIYLTRELLDTPYDKLGSIYNRDHSTIISSYHKIKTKLEENDDDYCEVIKELKLLLKT